MSVIGTEQDEHASSAMIRPVLFNSAAAKNLWICRMSARAPEARPPRIEPSKFRLGDRVRVKRTGEVDDVGEVLDDNAQREPRYVLMQDMGKPQVRSYVRDDLDRIEPGEAWALAENPNLRRDR